MQVSYENVILYVKRGEGELNKLGWFKNPIPQKVEGGGKLDENKIKVFLGGGVIILCNIAI